MLNAKDSAAAESLHEQTLLSHFYLRPIRRAGLAAACTRPTFSRLACGVLAAITFIHTHKKLGC